MVEPVKLEICVFPDLAKVSEAAAESIASMAHQTVSKKGRFTIALSGGETPRLLYQRFAAHYSEKMPWDTTHVFWGDERCLPVDHKDSNYNLAYQTFLSKVAIPPQNIHRIQAESENPEDAALSYERILREFLNTSEGDPRISFDLTLLGVGRDGHTASLFPAAPALEEKRAWVVAVDSPSSVKPPKRITLTYPVLNRSENIFFLVAGVQKTRIVRAVFQDLKQAEKIYPAAKVTALRKMIWYLDKSVMNDITNIS